MQYLTGEGTSYTYISPATERGSRVITVIFSAVIFITLAILTLIYIMMKQQGFSDELNILPVLAVIIIPVDIAMMLFLRRKVFAGKKIRLDCMNGRVYFQNPSALINRTEYVETARISAIVLQRRENPTYGRAGFGVGQYAILIETPSGCSEILRSGDTDSLRGVAEEMASILSLRVRDNI